MRHPWQTDTFDPGDPDLIDRVQAGTRLHEGFRAGATAYELEGTRWISMHGPYPYPCPCRFDTPFYRHLAYPMPGHFGEDPFDAMNAFERAWHLERERLWALGPTASTPEPTAPPPARPAPRVRRVPKERLLSLAGAVPLPGLEPWTGFGRRN